MAAATTEEDTELRDLLVQTLETSGVLNKIKVTPAITKEEEYLEPGNLKTFSPFGLAWDEAELRAAVFLALEEQEKVENKTPLINESLKKFLSTKDGRLVASLVAEFLQFFNLDFTLAVFQPESSTSNGLEPRESLAQDLGILEPKAPVDGPLLLEVVRRCQQKKGFSNSGDVAPVIPENVHSPPKSSDERSNILSVPSKIPRYKGHRKQKRCLNTTEQVIETSHSDTSILSGEAKSKGSIHFLPNEIKVISEPNKEIDTKEKKYLATEEDAEGDSFFDDPLPKAEQSYGWKNNYNKAANVASLSDSLPIKSGLNSLSGVPPLKESENANSILKDVKMVNSKLGSLELGEEDEYIDDFNSTSHRSEKSEVSIGEEIDDISMELEDFITSEKLEDLTQDFTVSQLSVEADYLEDVA